jgi:hypothetical protein
MKESPQCIFPKRSKIAEDARLKTLIELLLIKVHIPFRRDGRENYRFENRNNNNAIDETGSQLILSEACKIELRSLKETMKLG